MNDLQKLAHDSMIHAHAKHLVKQALAKLAAKTEDGPKFEHIAEPPSSDTIEPPKAPKSFKPPKLDFGPQSNSGTTDGALANNR